jgi:preprotein translocase subunit SecB
MKEAALHLEGYYVRELSVVLNESFADKMPFGTWTGYHYHPEKPVKIAPSQFEVKSEIGRKIGDASRWRYELSIRSSGRKESVPYTFRISLVGYFHVHKDLSQGEDDGAIIYVNAPSVLFSAAREALAAATARGPYPGVVLPLVSFVDEAKDIALKSAGKARARLLNAKPAKRGAKKRPIRKATKK